MRISLLRQLGGRARRRDRRLRHRLASGQGLAAALGVWSDERRRLEAEHLPWGIRVGERLRQVLEELQRVAPARGATAVQGGSRAFPGVAAFYAPIDTRIDVHVAGTARLHWCGRLARTARGLWQRGDSHGGPGLRRFASDGNRAHEFVLELPLSSRLVERSVLVRQHLARRWTTPFPFGTRSSCRAFPGQRPSIRRSASRWTNATPRVEACFASSSRGTVSLSHPACSRTLERTVGSEPCRVKTPAPPPDAPATA